MQNKELDNERLILSRISIGDEQAFTLIFNHYSKFIYSFALKLTRSDTIAEEILQDVFLKIWIGRLNLTAIENFGAYLNRVTRNHTYNILRRLAQAALLSEELSKQHPDEVNDTEDKINYRDVDQALIKAIAQLTPQQKAVYILCHQQGLKYHEAAGRLNIATSTVHTHMKQALHTIRTYFLRLNIIVFYFFLLK